jgi:hypothetical protein
MTPSWMWTARPAKSGHAGRVGLSQIDFWVDKHRVFHTLDGRLTTRTHTVRIGHPRYEA